MRISIALGKPHKKTHGILESSLCKGTVYRIKSLQSADIGQEVTLCKSQPKIQANLILHSSTEYYRMNTSALASQNFYGCILTDELFSI